jgi:hypothetical protein
MSKVFQCVTEHEAGFRKCLALHYDVNIDTPDLSNDIIDILNDPFTFSTIKFVMSIFKPATDALGRIEKEDSNLGDVWPQFIICRLEMNKVQCPAHYTEWKTYALRILETWAEKYSHPVYVLAFFLNPKFVTLTLIFRFRKVAVSKKYSLKDLKGILLKIAYSWGLADHNKLQTLALEATDYYNNKPPYNSVSVTNHSQYWNVLPHGSFLKEIAMKIFNISIHARGVESLFSIMSAIKTKSRNRMSVSTMKMMGQLKLMIFESSDFKDFMASKKKRKRNEQSARAAPVRTQSDTCGYSMSEMTESLDEFMGQVDLAGLEEASAWDENDKETIAINADLAGIARQEIQMESLFDFDGFVAAEEERVATDDAGNAFVIGDGPNAPLNLHNFEL